MISLPTAFCLLLDSSSSGRSGARGGGGLVIVGVKVGGACGGGVSGRARYLGGIEGGAPAPDGLGQRQWEERSGDVQGATSMVP